jgi:hypothetical protein
MLPETAQVEFGPSARLVEIQYAGFGFMLSRRSVYETVREHHRLPQCDAGAGRPLVPYFMPLLQSGPHGPWYLAEDYAFCERARQAGFQVMADPGIRLWHFGTKRYSWEETGSPAMRYSRYTFHIQ